MDPFRARCTLALKQALCAPYTVPGYRSPVPLIKFQMAPNPSTLISSGSKSFGVTREEKRHLQDLGVDGRIIMQWIFRNSMLGHRLDLLDFRQALTYTVMTALCEMWEVFYWHSNLRLCSLNFHLICLVLK